MADAGMWLGAEMERLEREDVAVGDAFSDGICGLIEDAHRPWSLMAPLAITLRASVHVYVLRRMEREMDEQTDFFVVDDGVWLGKQGGDYGVRAIFCYLMAEVSRD